MRQISFKTIEKNLQKKNAELVELRDFRRKLDAKEKEICAEIERLQNEKVEYIFAQVKKEIKNENLDISSGSILSLLEVLRKNQEIMNPEINSEEIVDSDLKISVEAKEVHEQRKNI